MPISSVPLWLVGTVNIPLPYVQCYINTPLRPVLYPESSSKQIAAPLKISVVATSNSRETNFRPTQAELSNGKGQSGEAVSSPTLWGFMLRL